MKVEKEKKFLKIESIVSNSRSFANNKLSVACPGF
jgi:hypothetical protein